MKNILLLCILMFLVPFSDARALLNYYDLLGFWSYSENDSRDEIILEFSGFEIFMVEDRSNPLILFINNEKGINRANNFYTGYYGKYNLTITKDQEALSYSGLWVSNGTNDRQTPSYMQGIYLTKDTTLEAFKENSSGSKAWSIENMKAYIQIKNDDSGMLLIVWGDLDYYLHYQRLFPNMHGSKKIKNEQFSTESSSSALRKDNEWLLFRKSEL